MSIRRLTLRRAEATWQVEDDSPLEGTLPAAMELPDSTLPIVGSWWEVVDKDGKVLYRDRLDDVSDPSMEVFEEDGSISRVEHPAESFGEHEPLIELLVPDLPEATDIRFVRAQPFGGADGRPQEIKQEVELVHIGREPRSKRGTTRA